MSDAEATDPMIDWLIDIHYPFDMTFDNPPPVDMTKLALRWKQRDGWDCTDEEAIDLIQGEAIPLTPSPV